MKNCLTLLAGLVLCVNASATSYCDIDTFGLTGQELGSTPFTSTFDIAKGDGDFGDKAGFKPKTQIVTSAIATFLLTDWCCQKATYDIDLGNSEFFDGKISRYSIQLVFGSLTANMLADLNADGSITYSLIQETGNSLKLNWASLCVEAECAPVPDGASSLILLGSALGGLNLLLRRSARRNS